MNLEQALAALQTATQDYGSARKSLAHHRGLAKHGIANELALAVAAEHSAFHRLERAQAAYAALQPAHVVSAPKPVAAPTKTASVVAPKTTVKSAPPSTHAAALAAHNAARRDVDRIRAEFEAADRRERQAHFAAVAAWNNSQTPKD